MAYFNKECVEIKASAINRLLRRMQQKFITDRQTHMGETVYPPLFGAGYN